MANVSKVVKNAIADVLVSIDGAIPVLDELSSNGFPEPAFYIRLVSLGQIFNRLSIKTQPITLDVHFFPTGKNTAHEECDAMAANLFDKLELLSIGQSRFRTRGMNADIQDGVLHFIIDYEIDIENVINSTTMGQFSNLLTVDRL